MDFWTIVGCIIFLIMLLIIWIMILALPILLVLAGIEAVNNIGDALDERWKNDYHY